MSAPEINSSPGTIVTFYSYKGGTGRSMALANMACLAAAESPNGRVLMIDWDLEAPGLHRYFPESDQPEHQERPGLIDYFIRLAELLNSETYPSIAGRDGAQALAALLPLDDYIASEVGPSLDLIKAGRIDRDYPDRISSFNWDGLFRNYHRVYRAFQELICARYQWCFVDSRTGLSDTSGICTMLMPEKLVTVFTPNRQSLDGVVNLATRAIEYRRKSDDARPLSVFPLPSRIVTEEHKLLQGAQERYRKAFEECLGRSYELNECALAPYFGEVAIPHKGFYGFTESVALRDDKSATDVLSINRAYERFWRRLSTLDAPWDSFADSASATPQPQAKAPVASKGGAFLSDLGFGNDVYISYSAVDDSPLGSESGEGFVTRIHKDLDLRLSQYLGEKVRIFRDSKLDGSDVFDPSAAIRGSAVFLAITSPRYLKSEWCRKERELFFEASKTELIAGSRWRVIHLDKTPVPREEMPPALFSTLGYQFYRVDEGGRAREFFIDNQGYDYYRAVDDLAQGIVDILKAMKQPAAGAPKSESTQSRIVYLAETASDMTSQREQLTRELTARGHQVIPTASLPLTGTDFARSVREQVSRADLTIHLVGDRRGIVPESEERSIVELQCEIALQIAKRCLVWTAPGSTGSLPLQRMLEQSSHSGAEIVTTNFEYFKGVVLDTLAGLSRPAPPSQGILPQIYLLHDKCDRDLAKTITEYLLSRKVEVAQPLFEGGASEIRHDRAETLAACDAAVILWGGAPEAWLRMMVREIRKIAARRERLPWAIYMTPPLDSIKQEYASSTALVVRSGSVMDLDPLIAQLARPAQS